MNTENSIVLRPRAGEVFYRNPLPPTHPMRQALEPYARILPGHAVETVGVIIEATPNLGRDPIANASCLNDGFAVARALNNAHIAGQQLVLPYVERARALVEEADDLVADARDGLDQASRVWTQLVTVAGQQVTRAGAHLAQDSAAKAAGRAEARGDITHLQRQTPSLLAWLGAGLVSAIEFGAVYTQVYNPVDLLSLLPLVAFTLLVFLGTHLVTKYIGRAIRAFRETRELRADRLDVGWAHLHSDAATARGVDAVEESDSAREHGLSLLGEAPAAASLRWKAGMLVFWGAICGSLGVFLVSVIAVRLYTMAMEAGRGVLFAALFSAFIALTVIGVLAALVWGYSRGSLLGRRLSELAVVNEETHARITSHVVVAQAGLDEASTLLARSGSSLAEGEEAYARHAAETVEAVQVAATILGVSRLDPVPTARFVRLPPFARRDVDKLTQKVATERATQWNRLAKVEWKEPNVVLPHESHYAERPGSVDVAELEPSRLGATVVAQDRVRRRRWPLIIAIAGGFVLLLTIASLALIVTTANADTPTPSPAHSGAVEGVDYTFLGAIDGAPLHWSCASPARVGLAGAAPEGAAGVIRAAVARIAEVSGLPLEFTAGSSAQITVSYVPDAKVESLGNADNAVGVTTAQSDPSGLIHSAQIDIAVDASVNAPSAATAEIVMLHELGHAVGLGHSTATNEIMAPALDPEKASQLGSGDIAALERVGCR